MSTPNYTTTSDITDYWLDPSTHVRFRPVCPDDKERFASEFSQLSDESKYCRCFAFRKELSGQELEMLCNVDGTSHVAFVVVSLDTQGQEHDGVGGARFIRGDANSIEAEMAFLIVDSWQQKHVGLSLLQHLMSIAYTQGVRVLRCYLLPENRKARRLLQSVSRHTGWTLSFDEDGALLNSSNLDAASQAA